MGIIVGFKNSQGVDIGAPLVERSYLMDRYPELADTFKQAGLWTWGDNGRGQLGDGTVVLRSSPVQVVAGNTGWKQVATGRNFSMAIKNDGTLWTWGDNTEAPFAVGGAIANTGQLGINFGTTNTANSRSSPVQTTAGGTNWKQISAAGFTAVAIKTDNTLWTWGKNDVGQLGDNTTTRRSSAVQTIAGGSNWKQVSVSETLCASVKIDGTLWTWGDNTFGALGTNNVTNRSSPGQTISNVTNWLSVVAGDHIVVSIKTDGTLWTWGRNDKGQLGDNTITDRSSPVQTVAVGTNWKQAAVAGGNNFISVAAIKTDGTLWTWGNNSNGEIGIANTVSVASTSSPGQIIIGANWKQIAGSSEHSDPATALYFGSYSAIKTDGTLWTWGSNRAGQLATGNTSGTMWKSVAIYGRGSAMAAIRDDSADMFGEYT